MLDRLKELIDGTCKPQNSIEEIFVRFYTKALRGNDLLTVILEAREDLDKFSENELSMIVLGYALGQKQRIDAGDGIDLDNKNKDNKPIH